jgi:hypothetical protein
MNGRTLALLLLLCLAAGHAAWGDNDSSYSSDTEEAVSSDGLFSMEELEDLFAPIALYPDPLIAQILPAATFIDQINEAARYVGQKGKYARIDTQQWDVSVKAVAHYPDLLFMMDREHDWTASLGQAFINQRAEVMQAIQLLRQDAYATGNLVSTPQQQVVVEEGYIRIIPARPDLVYLPDYDPEVVYNEPSQPGFSLITFGIGFTIGPWLNRDCDWHGHRVYYHGWRGRDWIERSRPHIRTRNNVYVNTYQTTIRVDDRIRRHNIEDYRRHRYDARRRQERQERRPGYHRHPVRREQKLEGRPAPGVNPPIETTQQRQPSRDRKQKLEGRPVLPATGQPQVSSPRLPPDKRRPSGEKTAPVVREQPGENRSGHDQPPHGRVNTHGDHTGTATPTPSRSGSETGRSTTVHQDQGEPGRETVRQSGHSAPAQPRQPPAHRKPEAQKQPAEARQSRPERSTPVQRPQVEQRPAAAAGGGDTTSRPSGGPDKRSNQKGR